MLVTMELIFAPIDGVDGIDQFTMEVSHFDSVRQIKQKIQELKGIPISRQSLLIGDGDVLSDDFNLRGSQIVEGSTIYLFLHEPPTTTTTTGRGQCPLLDARRRSILQCSSIDRAADVHNSAGISDQSGQQTDTGAVERLHTPFFQTHPATTIHSTGGVEGQSMRKRAREDIAESGTSSSCSRELTFYDMSRARNLNLRPAVATLTVVVVYREQQTAVVVSPEEEVTVLRGKLQQIDWRLPARCKFVSNHRVMNANRSFAYNRVREGDVIQVR